MREAMADPDGTQRLVVRNCPHNDYPPNQLQARKRLGQRINEASGSRLIAQIRAEFGHREEVTLGVDEYMALAPPDFL